MVNNNNIAGIKVFILIFCVFLGLGSGQAVLAQGLGEGLNAAKTQTEASKFQEETIKFKEGDATVYIASVVRSVLGIIGIFALLVVTYGGFLYLTSAGAQEQVQKAHKILLGGALGLILIFGAYTFAGYVVQQLQSRTLK